MSNLGIHADANFEYGDQFGRMTALKGHLAAVTMILNPNAIGKAAAAIEAAPIQVLRFYNIEENMKGTDTNGNTAAKNVEIAVNAIAPALSMYPRARWAYFRNELSDFSKAAFYAEEMKLWVEALAARNAYAAIGCFSFGTPDYGLWPTFDNALAAANAHDGYVALHEYGVITMKSAYEPARGYGHHCLRYRKVWQDNNYLKRFPRLRWAVTETGLDKDVNTGQGDGYKAIGKPLPIFEDELAWYDDEISKDGVTATLFEWATDPKWWAFDLNGPLADWLCARVASTTPKLSGTNPPIDIPPQPDPTPEPEPEPAPVELLNNPDFTGGTYAVVGNPDQQIVPLGWKASDARVRTEIERDPRFPVSARIIEAYEKREIGLLQEIAVTLGATYRITARVAGWCTEDASSPFSPSTSDATIRLRVNGTEAGSLPVQPGDLPTTYGTITRDVVATVDKWAVQLSIKPQYAMQRTDLRIDSVHMVKVKDAAPDPDPTPAPGLFKVVSGVNIRVTPNKSVAPVGSYNANAPVTVSKFIKGADEYGNPWWGEVAGQGTYVSAKYLTRS